MLTIVLPLGGREEFTGRFLAEAKKLGHVLMAGGLERLPVREWFTTIRDAVDHVDTPYVMLADNDDIPTKWVQCCVEWLDRNSDYVCCSGRIQGFHLWPNPVVGPKSAVTRQYSPFDTPAIYAQRTANERVLAGFANSWSYYAVYRTEVLRQIRREVCELELADLQVHEKFCAMRTLTLGKVRCDASFTSLYRQHGTSQSAYKRIEAVRTTDIAKVLTAMRLAGVNVVDLWLRWADWYERRDRYLAGKWRKRLRAALPNLAWLVQNRHRYLPHRSLI